MTTEKQSLKLDQIRIDGGTQSRVAIDEQTVSDYADLYRSDVDLKPVIVFFDGATYWLADGFHRFWANKREVKRNGTTYKMNTGNIGRSRKRKFKPTGGIAKDAFSTPAPHSLQSRVPMKNVDLPLNNPRKAAHCMVSIYGEEYMRTLCDELNHLFKEGNSND